MAKTDKVSGNFVSQNGTSIEISHGGKKGNTKLSVSSTATVELNGDHASLKDLQSGDTVHLTGDPVDKVIVVR